MFLEWYEEGEEGDGRSPEFTRREVTAAMAKALRDGAGRFIEWLQEAEESDSDEDSDEDGGDSEASSQDSD